MNKIKNIWFNIRHFKFNSIFLRTFLFITALTVIPFIVLSIMFYSNTLKNIREEIALENSYIFDNSVNIIDRISGEAGEDRSFGQKDFPVGPFFYQLLDLFPFTVLAGHCYEQKKDKDCAFHI